MICNVGYIIISFPPPTAHIAPNYSIAPEPHFSDEVLLAGLILLTQHAIMFLI